MMRSLSKSSFLQSSSNTDNLVFFPLGYLPSTTNTRDSSSQLRSISQMKDINLNNTHSFTVEEMKNVLN
jgi:hypothetical protein